MGNYHSDQPFQPEFAQPSGDFDPNNTEVINPDVVIDSIKDQTIKASQVMEVSIVEDHDLPLNQDWFNLARKLRGQNRELLDTIVKLEQALATSRQQLQNHQERSRQNNSLVSQQTAQLQSTQAQNSNLLEQIKVSQHKAQQQQRQIEVLEQQLQTIQEAFAKLERECAFLKEEGLQMTNQLVIKQRQITELQQRLQRQQRYALQYKAALDQCLSSNAKKIKSHGFTDNDHGQGQISPNVVAIQPWSSSTETLTTPNLSHSCINSASPASSSHPIDQTLEELFSLTSDATTISEDNPSLSENQGTFEEETQEQENQNSNPQDNMSPSPNALLVSSSVPFSFSIERHRKEDAAREKVDLPSFLRRQS